MHGTDEPMIRLERVTKTYDDGTVAVHELSLDVRRGELCVLVGPSGCGKTTTMKMINRLIDPSGGRVILDGDDVATIDPVQLRRRAEPRGDQERPVGCPVGHARRPALLVARHRLRHLGRDRGHVLQHRRSDGTSRHLLRRSGRGEREEGGGGEK